MNYRYMSWKSWYIYISTIQLILIVDSWWYTNDVSILWHCMNIIFVRVGFYCSTYILDHFGVSISMFQIATAFCSQPSPRTTTDAASGRRRSVPLRPGCEKKPETRGVSCLFFPINSQNICVNFEHDQLISLYSGHINMTLIWFIIILSRYFSSVFMEYDWDILRL